MTTTEFNLEFDVSYDNIASKGAPGLDAYEKSVYLTKAQLELVKSYNGLQNKYQKSFEGSEKRRVDLKELVVDFKTASITTGSNESISSKFISSFIDIPEDVFLIKFERAYTKVNLCNYETTIVPITLDEFNESINNPFRKPRLTDGWRLDINSEGINNRIEILTAVKADTYHMRYLKFPSPIILTTLDAGDFTGMGLSINGEVNEQSCKLNEEIHSEILDRAVELAARDYKDGSLQSKIQLNNRNN